MRESESDREKPEDRKTGREWVRDRTHSGGGRAERVGHRGRRKEGSNSWEM